MRERGRIVLGLVLLAAGGIFLLDAADVIGAWSTIARWWPAVFVVLGLIALLSTPRSLVSGGILVAIGAVLLTSTLNLVNLAIWQLAIPMVLIGIGLGLILRGYRPGGVADAANRVSSLVILGEQHVISRASAFRGGTLTAILGEVKLDLRQASIDPDGAVIDTFSSLGDVTVIVPANATVHASGMPVLGDFEDKTRPTNPDEPAGPVITVTGVALLGDVTIRSSE